MGDWREYIIDFLGDHWELKGRPDLFQDVVEHIMELYPERILEESYGQDRTDVVLLGEAFAFLQTHCTSALSSDDLKFMAEAEEEERRKNEQSL